MAVLRPQWPWHLSEAVVWPQEEGAWLLASLCSLVLRRGQQRRFAGNRHCWLRHLPLDYSVSSGDRLIAKSG